ncbi:MAG TPA: hypothetical protein VHX37_04725 [Acidobacteriaceae bacterium]|nr:hypothetical protein [Acidobacteriaceae bacterium]
MGCADPGLMAQTANQKSLSDQVDRLTESMARAQQQLEESQRELSEMRAQLTVLRSMMGKTSPPDEATAPSSLQHEGSATNLAAAVEDLRERQAVQQAQIDTHEQSKVESESKYPVKVTGLLLLSSFVNTSAVDMAATPAVAVPGPGSTGATMRQTVLGLEATGPHLLGARSYADLRVDFDATPNSGPGGTYSGYSGATAGLLRLRTAHAGLQWERTNLAFSLDRPIISPDSPTSLTAVSIPPLAWSGNLWTWNPQVVVTHDFDLTASRQMELQAALTDVADAPLTPLMSLTGTPPSTAEQSRWPGIEAHLSFPATVVIPGRAASRFGAGGYFEPHESLVLGRRFDSWAATLDASQPLPGRLEFTASAYRGQALGGLGGGAYKDIAYRPDADTGSYYTRVLDDVGGWAQLKERFSEKFEMNASFGIDNLFAGELRRYAVPGGSIYQNLARNRTYAGNAIYSPRAWLLFSLDYRYLVSSPESGAAAASNIIGLGAGYRF